MQCKPPKIAHPDYRQNWELWPGKGELYEGGEPHGALFTTYMNPIALEALQSKAGAMPNGAIIVKENYTPDAVFSLVTLMYKVEGYDPENNDWFWAKINFPKVIQHGRSYFAGGNSEFSLR